MERVSAFGGVIICLSLTVACGGGERDEATTFENGSADVAAPLETDENERPPMPITVTGCLSSDEGRYVLTELEETDPAPGGPRQATTESYQLTNADEQLRAHVGSRVRITGEAEPARVAIIRESTPPAPPEETGTTGQQGSGGLDPNVSSVAETQLEVRRLMVSSVEPAAGECPTEEPGR